MTNDPKLCDVDMIPRNCPSGLIVVEVYPKQSSSKKVIIFVLCFFYRSMNKINMIILHTYCTVRSLVFLHVYF